MSVTRYFVPGRNRGLAIFAATSLALVGAGCFTMAASGLPAALWSRNLAAWLAGAIGAAMLARTNRSPALDVMFVAAALLALAMTFLGDGQAGVHRWLDLGPLQINAAALLLPLTIVALSRVGVTTVAGALGVLALAALLLLQPDASQMLGLALAATLLVWSSSARLAARLGVTAAAALLVEAARLRPDPLQPVPEVELIFSLAWNIAPTLALIAVVLLVLICVSPLLFGTGRGGPALAAYFGGVALAPLYAWYPVPLMGLGMSFVVGHWLAIGLLTSGGERPDGKPISA